MRISDWSSDVCSSDLGLHLFEQRLLPGPGWKVTMDGYLEAYHHDSVHANTLSKHTIGNLLVHDIFGHHQVLTMARRNIADLDAVPEIGIAPCRDRVCQ